MFKKLSAFNIYNIIAIICYLFISQITCFATEKEAKDFIIRNAKTVLSYAWPDAKLKYAKFKYLDIVEPGVYDVTFRIFAKNNSSMEKISNIDDNIWVDAIVRLYSDGSWDKKNIRWGAYNAVYPPGTTNPKSYHSSKSNKSVFKNMFPKNIGDTNTLDDVYLIQSFFKDTPIAGSNYATVGFNYGTYSTHSSYYLGFQAGFPINPRFEIDAELDIINFDSDFGYSNTGISDLLISGRYNIENYINFMPDTTKMSAGAYLTLPIGSDETGEGDFNIGVFSALRHPLGNGVVITGTFGLDSYVNVFDDRKFSVLLGGGTIIPINEVLSLTSELQLRTGLDYMMLSFGGDYSLDNSQKIRAGMGIGFDDGAPDFYLMLNYLFFF